MRIADIQRRPKATSIPSWNVYLGDDAVGDGYPTREAALAAARRFAEEHGSLPLEVRRV